jgi:hypothetical protein
MGRVCRTHGEEETSDLNSCLESLLLVFCTFLHIRSESVHCSALQQLEI